MTHVFRSFCGYIHEFGDIMGLAFLLWLLDLGVFLIALCVSVSWILLLLAATGVASSLSELSPREVLSPGRILSVGGSRIEGGGDPSPVARPGRDRKTLTVRRLYTQAEKAVRAGEGGASPSPVFAMAPLPGEAPLSLPLSLTRARLEYEHSPPPHTPWVPSRGFWSGGLGGQSKKPEAGRGEGAAGAVPPLQSLGEGGGGCLLVSSPRSRDRVLESGGLVGLLLGGRAAASREGLLGTLPAPLSARAQATGTGTAEHYVPGSRRMGLHPATEAYLVRKARSFIQGSAEVETL